MTSIIIYLIDVQRLLKQRRNLSANTVIAPVVLTSVLGMNNEHV